MHIANAYVKNCAHYGVHMHTQIVKHILHPTCKRRWCTTCKKTGDRLCRQEMACSPLTNTLSHTHTYTHKLKLETCTLTKTLAHKLTHIHTERKYTCIEDSYKNKDTHIYVWATSIHRQQCILVTCLKTKKTNTCNYIHVAG